MSDRESPVEHLNNSGGRFAAVAMELGEYNSAYRIALIRVMQFLRAGTHFWGTSRTGKQAVMSAHRCRSRLD